MPFVHLFIGLVTVVPSGSSALIPIQSDGTSEPISATTDLANQAVPLSSGKKKTSTLLKNIPKPGRTGFLRDLQLPFHVLTPSGHKFVLRNTVFCFYV